MLIRWKDNRKGVSIIEILIVIAIIVIAFIGLFGLVTFSLRISNLIRETNQANNLAQEALEAVRNFRDGTSWNTNGLGILNNGVSYYPNKSSDNPPKWQMIAGEETAGSFRRKVVFYEVRRDANDNIVETGGTIDPNTKKITVTISWRGGNKEVKIITYLTNWR